MFKSNLGADHIYQVGYMISSSNVFMSIPLPELGMSSNTLKPSYKNYIYPREETPIVPTYLG